jgi:transcriptional antiterminator
MDVENNFIKPILLFYYGKGVSEAEAHKEIVKQYGQHAITYKTIKKWFIEFRKEGGVKDSRPKQKKKVSDEYIIDLVYKNPGLNLDELGKLAKISGSVISRRLKKINDGVGIVSYKNKIGHKSEKKFTDKFLIGLVDENPGKNMKELAELADCCESTIYNRLREINKNRSKGRKIILQKSAANAPRKSRRLTNEFIINLVNENPGIGMKKIAELANYSISTISKRLREINSCGEIVYYYKRGPQKIDSELYDESSNSPIIKNSEFDTTKLVDHKNISTSATKSKPKEINSDSEEVKYEKKKAKKISDEFLISLVNENPGLSMRELAMLANASASTICNRIKKINGSGEKLIYFKKPDRKFTDEFLINLINENPALNMKGLAELAKVSEQTISHRIKRIKIDGGRLNYVKKYQKIKTHIVNC